MIYTLRDGHTLGYDGRNYTGPDTVEMPKEERRTLPDWLFAPDTELESPPPPQEAPEPQEPEQEAPGPLSEDMTIPEMEAWAAARGLPDKDRGERKAEYLARLRSMQQ